jgi:hypothetical protein
MTPISLALLFLSSVKKGVAANSDSVLAAWIYVESGGGYDHTVLPNFNGKQDVGKIINRNIYIMN